MMSAMQNLLGPWLVSLRHYVYLCLLLSSPARLPYHPQAIVFNIFSYPKKVWVNFILKKRNKWIILLTCIYR